MHRRLSPEQEAEVCRLYLTGEWTQKQLREKFGISQSVTNVTLAGLKKRRSILNKWKRKELLRLRREGYTIKELATEFYVVEPTVRRYLKYAEREFDATH